VKKSVRIILVTMLSCEDRIAKEREKFGSREREREILRLI
jgi:hypothetical protein